tara:strand:+ start:64 stop:339 length:276 start_codon:yes stop_codon:yes gene_type:complete
MKDLVELTIDYGDGKTETMVVTKESNAYMTMLEYAEQNDYPIAEEPFLSDKEKNALEVAIDRLIESLESDTEEYQTADKLKAIKSVKEKLG